MAVADRLGKTLAEMADMTVAEFNAWQAYLLYLNRKTANGA